MAWNQQQLSAAKDQHRAWVKQQPGIEGMAIGADANGQLCLKVLTNQASAETKRMIADRLKDIPVVFEETGAIRSF